jgi:uncharacterized protein YacL
MRGGDSLAPPEDKDLRVAKRGGRGALAVVELVRLGIVVLLTAVGYSSAPAIAELVGSDEPETLQLVASVLGALLGYLLGGVLGRQLLRRVDVAQDRLRRVDAAVLVATSIGAVLGGLLGMVLSVPLLLLPNPMVTVPIAMVVLVVGAYAGGRLGAVRGGDLSRYVGVRGRLEVSSPSRGGGTKIVDTSALVDGRIVDIARAGFLDGTLVVPGFVLAEAQGLADAEAPRKRSAGRRALATVHTL